MAAMLTESSPPLRKMPEGPRSRHWRRTARAVGRTRRARLPSPNLVPEGRRTDSSTGSRTSRCSLRAGYGPERRDGFPRGTYPRGRPVPVKGLHEHGAVRCSRDPGWLRSVTGEGANRISFPARTWYSGSAPRGSRAASRQSRSPSQIKTAKIPRSRRMHVHPTGGMRAAPARHRRQVRIRGRARERASRALPARRERDHQSVGEAVLARGSEPAHRCARSPSAALR